MPLSEFDIDRSLLLFDGMLMRKSSHFKNLLIEKNANSLKSQKSLKSLRNHPGNAGAAAPSALSLLGAELL